VAPGTQQGAQYFARYAEPEARLAASLSESYAASLVVPVCGEIPALLDGFRVALEAAPGRVLLVLVVNATASAGVATHAANRELLDTLEARFPGRIALRAPAVDTRAALGRAANYDILWLDRASPGLHLPEREGVGTARKIGGDFAVALWARGHVACPLLASSDADVTLPSDYFAVLARAPNESVRSSAWLWPFHHVAGEDASIDEATVLYEISLRYYVLGLSAAASSYAYQSIGSTLCVDAPSYLSVRGFPKRAAGEDFYLLDKLAKVGPLRRVDASPVLIRARASERVPFGTGRRTQEIAEEIASGSELLLYSPGTFSALAAVIAGLDAFALEADVHALERILRARVPDVAEAAVQVLGRLGVFAALNAAVTQAPAGRVLRRRIHTWFDALRTLRFIHGMRDSGLPSLPWRAALAAATFLPDRLRVGDSPASVCQALAESEAALPAQVGPALL
jgi:hypothetical protein